MGIGEVGELLRRSTVQVRTSTRDGRRLPSSGSGVLWDGEGTVITNAHVLGRGSHVVELWDGRSFPAEVQAFDAHRDLAKLKLASAGLPRAEFRTSAVKPGELVIAVGNPLGFTGALTTGVVHAAGQFPGLGRRPWVQAAIRLAPGNSGGPLADAAGAVVGINTMVVSGGLALAIPSADVEEFVRNGQRPRLGVTVRPVSLEGRRGPALALLILDVERGSPAEQASLLIGDLLIGTDQTPFTSAFDLADSIADTKAGQLKLRFLRGDRSHTREVVVSFSGRLNGSGRTTREAA